MSIRLALGPLGQQAVQTLDEAIMALSPAGYWKLDETSGTTANDSSGNNNHGTYSGSYTLDNETGPDGSPVCDFSGGKVTISAGAATYDRTNPLTIFALVKPDSVTSTGRRFIVTKGGAGVNNYEYDTMLNDGALQGFSYETSGGVRQGYTSDDAIAAAATWAGVGVYIASGAHLADISLYADSGSALAATQHSPLTSTSTNAAGGVVTIADRADGGATEFAGAIARVAIFTSEVDLSAIMASASAEGWF